MENNGALPGEFLTLSGGTASGSTGDLPGGTYNVYAYYGGDVNHSGSKSGTAIPVNISPEPSTLAVAGYVYDPKTYSVLCDDTNNKPCSGVSVPYGYATSINAQPEGQSGSVTTATGKISLSDSAGNLNYNYSGTLTTANPISVPIANGGIATYDNWYYQNQSLSVTSHTLSASYSGDASYQASGPAGLTLKVAQGATTTVAQATQASSTITLQAQVNPESIGVAPTGTVTFKNGTTVLGTVQTSSATGFVTNGTNQGTTVAALYSLQIPSSQLSSSAKVAKLNHNAFSWKLSGGLAVACIFLFTIPARRRNWRAMLGLVVFALLISNVIACGSSPNNSGGGGGGSGSITAVYAGDTNYTGSTSAAVTVTVSQ